jgi:hypothetical protein
MLKAWLVVGVAPPRFVGQHSRRGFGSDPEALGYNFNGLASGVVALSKPKT